ncbi:MAG: hypothetical protein JXR83_20180 [Deltaproteobacteria bacterium]|nr:hypothetical protein [Deltaproteobacteria bacterium]
MSDVNVIGGAARSRWGFLNRPSLPQPPPEAQDVRAAARRNYPEHAWTGLNYIHASSASDVNQYLGEQRDASRSLVSANADLWVLRHSYHTNQPMHAWLQSRPANDQLVLQVTITPSWHAEASGGWSVTGALQKAPVDAKGLPKIDAALVRKAIESSPSFAAELTKELGSLDKVAQDFVSYYGYWLGQQTRTPDDAKKYLGELVKHFSCMAMGEKFSKENFYNILIKLPDGKQIRKRFDVTGKESSGRSLRTDRACHATTSPEVSIDISKFKGKDIVIQAWPDGSAGVGGYREARETVLHL